MQDLDICPTETKIANQPTKFVVICYTAVKTNTDFGIWKCHLAMNPSVVSFCRHMLVLFLRRSKHLFSWVPVTDKTKQNKKTRWFLLSQACRGSEVRALGYRSSGERLAECGWSQNSFIMEESHPRIGDHLFTYLESSTQLLSSSCLLSHHPNPASEAGSCAERREDGGEGGILISGEDYRPDHTGFWFVLPLCSNSQMVAAILCLENTIS